MQSGTHIKLIDSREVAAIVQTGIENQDRREGVTLVDISSTEDFEREHIPTAINIAEAVPDDFERRFDRRKRICLYGKNAEFDTESLAQELAERGFSEVLCYLGGVEEWRESGHEVTKGPVDSVIELDIA